MTDIRSDIPEGFQHHVRPSPITTPWEPIYYKSTEDAVMVGLRIAERHSNSRGFAHGGLLATLADNAMGLSCGAKRDGGQTRLLTAGLSIDFISSAKIGQWLTVESQVIKVGGNLCFAQCLLIADDTICARANGTFSVVRQKA